MTLNLAFLLEDEQSDRAVLENRLRAIGLVPTTYPNVEDARRHLDVTGDIYSVYFLDMQVPVCRDESPVHKGGLELRDYLISKKVSPEKIFLISGIVSYQDERAAAEYDFPPDQIIGKDQFTEKFLRELLA